MVNWNTIEELKNIFINEYIITKLGSKLENACNDEYELSRDYNGRQILELLQNVDDACSNSGKTNDEVVVKISFNDNILEVGNTGTVFTQETIERLCQGKASNKSSKNIGNKGTGFRSLLNDAEWIEVHSGGFSVRFSEKYAKEQFEKYAATSPVIKRQKQSWQKEYDLCFPIMHCPEQIEKRRSEFDTLIRVKINDKNRSKEAGILNQLNQPFYKSLLFLPNITKIVIEIDGETKEYKKCQKGNKVSLSQSQNAEDTYYVVEKNDVGIYGNKVADLIIAVPLDAGYDFSKEKLYCYFPIRNCNTPVNALVHAPFLTNSSRDDIPNDNEQINKKIFQKCLKFLKEVAENIVNDKSLPKDLAIKTVTPTNDFTGKVWDDDFFNLKSFYLQLLADAKLLPTVNDKFISINDEPKCFSCEFPEEFKGGQFKGLLKQLPAEAYKFVRLLANKKSCRLEYTSGELKEKIDFISDKLNVASQVKIFLWLSFNWWRDFRRYYEEIPQLLKDSAGKWVDCGTKIYLPTDTGISILPKSLAWVKLCVLDQAYVAELIKQIQSYDINKWNGVNSGAEAGNKRMLDRFSDKYFPINFIEQSNADVIVDEINRQVDTCEKAIDFIRWIYESYNNQVQYSGSRFNLAYKLPDRDGNLRNTEELFFGKEYGSEYELSERIFGYDDKKFAVADCNGLFKDCENEREEVVDFLKRCGVSIYPKIYTNINLASNSSFKDYLIQTYGVSFNINYISAKYIDGFEEAISLLDTKEVAKWITDDIDLYNLITSREKEGKYSNKRTDYGHFIYSNEYITYILNITQWIKIGDKKYSPNEIVKYPKLKDKIDGIYGISEQELIKVLGNKSVVQDMGLGFVPTLAAFPDEIIYKILLKLPTFDGNGEISKSLYEDITHGNNSKKDVSPSYSINDLQVYATDDKFHINTEVRYADRRLPKAMRGKIPFINIHPKRNMDIIKNWFGVERYETAFELVDLNEILNLKDFNSELSDIKICALSILDEIRDTNVQNVKRLKIIPCNRILVRDIENGNAEVELDDYNYIKDAGKYYIKLPANAAIEQIREALDFRTSVVEIFEASMERKLDQKTLEYLLLNGSAGKKSIIDSDYGIDKWSSTYELLYQRSIINDSVIGFFKHKNLGGQLLEPLKEIDFSERLSVREFNALKRSLIEIEKDIKDLNDFSEQLLIDIRPCIKEEFSKYKDTKYDAYRVNCYNYAIANKEAQKTFLENCNRFRLFELDLNNIENSIRTDYEAILAKEFKEYSSTAVCADIDIDVIYSQNYKAVISKGFSRDLLEFYLETKAVAKSLLYFEVPETIFDDLTELSKKEAEDTDDGSTQSDAGDGQPETAGEIIEAVLLPANTPQDNAPYINSEKSPERYKKDAANRERAGKKAEEIAYASLKEEYPGLIWHSKNSSNPADKHRGPIGVVCDMWAPDLKGGATYFEVKSATNEFEMSIHEYISMEKNKDNYFVVLVDNATRIISLHKFDELNNLKQVSKYKFCFTLVEKH